MGLYPANVSGGGGVLCFHVGHPCVCSSIVCTSNHRHFQSVDNDGFSQIWICICTNSVLLGIVNGLVSKIVTEFWHVNVQKMVFMPPCDSRGALRFAPVCPFVTLYGIEFQ